MKVEYQENQRPKKKKSRRKKQRAIILACASIVLVLSITVILMLTVFFNVENNDQTVSIKVLGSSIYSSEEVIHNSGILDGDNIIMLDEDEISARIEKALPYIKKAEILKSLPDSVGIKVTPATEAYLLDLEEGLYISDSDYKLLRTTEDRSKDLLRIKGVLPSKLNVGECMEFSDKQQRDTLNALLKMCSDKGFSVNYINVESLIDIGFSIENRLYVKLGSYNDLSGKLTHLEEMLKSVSDDVAAVISLDSWTVENKRAVLKYGKIDDFIK